jgi:glutamate synthase domain-containing protein 2
MRQEPWIDADAETVEKIIKTIRKCPSGALSYETDGVLYVKFNENGQVMITEDGPYYVSGSIKLEDDDAPTSEEHYALCRCGKSKNKPYCDGHHWYIKFKDDGLVKEEAECNCSQEHSYDNKYETIKHLAKTGHSVHKSMRTEKPFAGLETILFKSAQIHSLPLPDKIVVNTKTVIGKNAKQPLHLAMPFYVSHMSFGAISKEAKIALAKGSSIVNTAMCSGEGGMLAESREAANIYIYELGTAQFSHDEKIIKQADAIEIKMGQAAKPGHGGSLPADKVSAEIAAIRGIALGKDGITPSRMTGVDSTNDLRDMVAWLRKITDGKPIGIKFAAGNIEEDIEAALYAAPDFITVDCRGGATGSSPTFIKDNICVSPVYAIRRARRYLDSKDTLKLWVSAAGAYSKIIRELGIKK